MTTGNPAAGQVTDADVVETAYGVLGELTEGTLSGATVQQRAAEVCRRTFGVVGSGPDDPLWSLHADVTRQFLGAGGLTAAELTEWLAVARNRENPGRAMDDPSASGSSVSEPYSHDSDGADGDAVLH